MRSKLNAVLAAGLIGLSGAASAATYDIGNLSLLGNAGYGQSVSFSGGVIDDQFDFSISGGDNTFGAVISKLSIFSDQLLSFFSGTLTGPGGFSQSLALGATSIDPAIIQSVTYNGMLGNGDYSLAVAGTSIGSGTYQVSLLATPVPEPESIAMLLAGLGLMGAIARRRNKGQSSLQA